MRPGVTGASVKPRRPPQPLSAHEQKKKGYADQERRGSPTKRQFGHPRDPGEREQDGRGYRHQQPIERAASRLGLACGLPPIEAPFHILRRDSVTETLAMGRLPPPR